MPSVRRALLLPIGLVAAVAAVAAGAGAWPGSQDEVQTAALRYDSVRSMATRAGCLDTLSPVADGAALDAGECTVGGVRVQLRVFATGNEAMAWGDGARAADTGPADPMATGPNWVARMVDADISSANRVLAALT